MDKLYISGFVRNNSLCLPTVSAVTVFIMEYCHTKSFELILICEDKIPDGCAVTLPWHSFSDITVLNISDCPHIVQNCTTPVVKSCNKVVSGLCGVLRHVLKKTAKQEKASGLLQLLGHKQICLKACAEISPWTKFCEVNFPKIVDQLLLQKRPDLEEISIPDEMLKLEKQFQQPCIIANINKRIHRALKSQKEDFDSLMHLYVEGPDMTLADLILLPCVNILLDYWKHHLPLICQHLPLVFNWVERLCSITAIEAALASSHLPKPPFSSNTEKAIKPVSINLPKTDLDTMLIRASKVKKFKLNSRDLDNALHKLSLLQFGKLINQVSYDVKLPWQTFPEAVHPKDGELPKERLERKCQQLENLATAVMMIAKHGDIVVDFCAGGGHLGILLAYLLPHCKIILIENKEESIQRAETRIEKLQLNNVTIYQCNIDYFMGSFHIGVSLHACGVATDLVLQHCLSNHASFVTCPCCYGNIQDTHTITYPRSKFFKEIGLTYTEYLNLGHGADQTQFNIPAADQGKQCMLYIDMDRVHLAMEYGYKVTLTTLKPLECSPKNNLLIGIPS